MTFLSSCFGCGNVPTANDKGMYTKLRMEDDSEGASKCR